MDGGGEGLECILYGRITDEAVLARLCERLAAMGAVEEDLEEFVALLTPRDTQAAAEQEGAEEPGRRRMRMSSAIHYYVGSARAGLRMYSPADYTKQVLCMTTNVTDCPLAGGAGVQEDAFLASSAALAAFFEYKQQCAHVRTGKRFAGIMGAPTLALEAFRMEAIGGGPAASAAYLVCATSQSADRSHLQAAQDSLLCLQSVLDDIVALCHIDRKHLRW